ncbi:MAG: transposase, partial [Candidatus Kapabacteria bacterium]|nr:transposase [Candidatus Kapabacteria bacterium]
TTEFTQNTPQAQSSNPTVAQTFLSVQNSQKPQNPELQKTRRNLPHWTLEGSTYFVTFTARTILQPEEQNMVYQHITQGDNHFYELQALVIMPDHVHLVFRLQDHALDEVMKGMKGVTANLINQHRNTRGENIWQEESFDRIIRDEREWQETVKYIEENPLKIGLVGANEQYPYLWTIGAEAAPAVQKVAQTRMSVLRQEDKQMQPQISASTDAGSTLHTPQEISPHIMVMSATPIPRTLSMTVYGDLDVSIIDELPKNRKPIKTKVVFESKLPIVFQFIREQIEKGHQAYIVYPLVEKSEKVEAKSAVEHFEHLQHEVFPDLKLGLLHGQMFWYEKEDAMKAFKNKEFQILVATTVVEVGIDVPNATVMLIENAERFGLAQLHQLRGRVGRGAEQSYCLLATKDHFKFHIGKKETAAEERKSSIIRLKTMQDTSDGFKIAEVDLKLRGPGDFLGTRQSGIPEFTFADLITDGDVISVARREAFALVADDPHLRKTENATIRTEFLRQNQKDFTLLDVA